jgi:hypothetical protein
VTTRKKPDPLVHGHTCGIHGITRSPLVECVLYPVRAALSGGIVTPNRPPLTASEAAARQGHPVTPLYVAGLWRYPIKTLGGEPLSTAVVRPGGIEGDRIVRVHGPEGVRTSRRHYRLLGLRGTWSHASGPLINGHRWDGPEALALVKAAAGDDAWLEACAGPERFDVLPLLVATDGAVAAFGRDVRRLRPNILIGGVHGLDETAWPGAELHVGDAIVRLDSLRSRCPMTTVDPDTLARDPEVLRDIGRRFGGRLALNADVARTGTIGVGDVVTLVHSGMGKGSRDPLFDRRIS